MKITLLALASASLASCASMGFGDGNPQAAAQFERLKTLQGEWVTTSGGGDMPAGAVVRYHVTSGGTALLETISPDSPDEMVTLIHRDGDELVLTHYCTLGNQPHMVAEAGTDPNTIRFRFAGGANIDASKDQHMHSAEFTFIDDAHVTTKWTLHDGGKATEVAQFPLVRSWR